MNYKELADRLSAFIIDDEFLNAVDDTIAILRSLDAQPGAPIDMVLFCPACGMQHIDAPEEVPGMPIYKSAPTPNMPHRMEQVGTYTGQGEWKNPPHRSHLCHDCGHIWRPADVPTNGVKAVKTVGKADSPIAAPVAAQPTDQSVTPEYLSWLVSVQPRAGVGGNEAWNAGVAWAKAAPVTADDLKEPKNGKQWHVEWWNESCRMMLPSGSKLDSFHSYKNGTLQFTIKKTDKSIKE